MKSSGLRWVCVMLSVEDPWASPSMGFALLDCPGSSERYAARQGKRHKKITEWAWQLLLVLRRWYPEREIVPSSTPRLCLSQVPVLLPNFEQTP